MDPYLESYLWPDVHNGLAFVIKELLGPKISPKYVARTELYTVEDTSPEEDVGIMYPDIDVLRRKNIVEEPHLPPAPKLTPPTISIPATKMVEVRIPFIEIRDREKNQLITAIEILSPVNKRLPGLPLYREKRDRLHQAGVHLLEIDLIRRGTRPFNHPYLPKNHYIIALLRADDARTEIWGVDLKDKLPVVPVPLKSPDPDVPLDLGEALNVLYERSLYHLSIDYAGNPPPPEFTAEENQWMAGVLERFL